MTATAPAALSGSRATGAAASSALPYHRAALLDAGAAVVELLGTAPLGPSR